MSRVGLETLTFILLSNSKKNPEHVAECLLGTLSIDDESDDEDEPEVILTDKTILRMSCFVFADVTRRLLFVHSRSQSPRFFWSRGQRNEGLW